MLQYRLVNDTDDFAEGTSHKMVLFMIHNDVTYEHHVDQTYDTQRIIATMGDFIIDAHNEYIDAKYHSATFRLMPVGENIALIIKLRAEVESLKQQLSTRQTLPDYLPPNLSLLCTIEYLPWDTLEDMFYMYPIDETHENYKTFNKKCDPTPLRLNYNYTCQAPAGYMGVSLMAHKAFTDDLLKLNIAIDTFDPNDAGLNQIISDNKDEEYHELSKSCLPPYTQNKKINIHILNFISYISRYYITSFSHTVSIHCYVNTKSLFIQIIKYKRDLFYKAEINGPICGQRIAGSYGSMMSTFYYHKYRMNFYIDDWAAPPIVVYV